MCQTIMLKFKVVQVTVWSLIKVEVILIVVISITIIKILPPLASVLRTPKVTGPGYRTSVLQLGSNFMLY